MDISRNTVTGEIAKETKLSGNFRKGNWVDCIDRTTGNVKTEEKPLIDAWELAQAKKIKYDALTANRDRVNILPIEFDGYEIIDDLISDNLVKFIFLTAPTGNTATEPNNLLFQVRIAAKDFLDFVLPYSCKIINDNGTTRKGYVAIDGALANSLAYHFTSRSTNNIKVVNSKKKLIEEAKTMEELEATDIDLPLNKNLTRFL